MLLDLIRSWVSVKRHWSLSPHPGQLPLHRQLREIPTLHPYMSPVPEKPVTLRNLCSRPGIPWLVIEGKLGGRTRVTWGVCCQGSWPGGTWGDTKGRTSVFEWAALWEWLLKMRLYFFRAVIGSQQNWAEGTEISHLPPTPTYAPASPVINVPHLSGTVLIVDEAALTHHYDRKSIVCIRAYSWGRMLYGFGQMINDFQNVSAVFYIHSLWILYSVFLKLRTSQISGIPVSPVHFCSRHIKLT